MKSGYLISCASIALLSAWGPAAMAADRPAAADSASAPASVEEVIVTANRRDESAQKVAATIQAFSSETLTRLNVTDLNELLRFTPNVTIASNGPGQGNIFMRGMSTGSAGNQSSATVGNFPNVAVYLDDQSMQFPSRNVDIFVADMQRVEVLEGPQGTLFGGGAEAGALRYITNKPKLGVTEGKFEASYGYTQGGDPNSGFSAMLNVPIGEKLAVRAVLYSDKQGGYIDNVPSTFTHNQYDAAGGPALGCPTATAGGTANCVVGNNYALASNAQNPLTHDGVRVSLAWDIAPDWDLLLVQSVQNLDAEGSAFQYGIGSDQQTLKPLQNTIFSPMYDRDNFENTAWTVNGKVGDLKVVYTGSYMDRHLRQQSDYTNYSRTGSGQYYSCADGAAGIGKASLPTTCYSPVTSWNDKVQNTHLTNEFRLSTPDTWRLRAVGGVFFEQFRIYDVMNFNYVTIPNCNAGNNLAIANAGGATCVGSLETAPGTVANQPGVRGPTTGFGEDVRRGYDQTAFFGQVDYDLIPKTLILSAGTRHYEYDETEDGSVYATGTGCADVSVCTGATPIGTGPGKPNPSGHVSTKFTGFKSRFGVQYKPNDDTMFYYTYSEGFRPGGFSRTSRLVAPLTTSKTTDQLITPLSYAPDTLRNNEVGMKSELFERRLQLNVTAYYMKWNDTQFGLYDPCCLGNTTFLLNGPSYVIRGMEAQFNARVTEGLSLQGSATYNENRQANSPILASNVPTSSTYGQQITTVKNAPFFNPFGTKGGVAAFAPQLQANLRARYDWTVNEYKAFASLDGAYTSHQYNEPASYVSGNTPSQIPVPNTTILRYRIAPYATLGGSIGATKDNWTFQIIGSNLLNSHASTFTTTAQFIKAEVPLRPRVIGVKISESF